MKPDFLGDFLHCYQNLPEGQVDFDSNVTSSKVQARLFSTAQNTNQSKLASKISTASHLHSILLKSTRSPPSPQRKALSATLICRQVHKIMGCCRGGRSDVLLQGALAIMPKDIAIYIDLCHTYRVIPLLSASSNEPILIVSEAFPSCRLGWQYHSILPSTYIYV